ncbi:MAG: cupin domain-containing protein [Nevskiales bacterium]
MTERITPEVALRQLEGADGRRYLTIFKHGQLELEYYKPVGEDPQKPHTRDEVYFVISGSGWFVQGSERQRFSPGEVIYAPARTPHHFEDFSEDFATWAIFSS